MRQEMRLGGRQNGVFDEARFVSIPEGFSLSHIAPALISDRRVYLRKGRWEHPSAVGSWSSWL